MGTTSVLLRAEITLPSVSDVPQPLVDSIQVLFGPDLPPGIIFQAVEQAEPALANSSFISNFDEGFCGHFSIPGDPQGAAVYFEDVLLSPDPFEVIESSLLFTPDAREDIAVDEVVIFSPGLNTMHAPDPELPDETTTPQRLQHYVNVLGVSMSQMHMGTDFDQGEAVLQLTDDAFIALLQAQVCVLEAYGIMPVFTESSIVFSDRQRDYVETVLSSFGYVTPLLQRHFVQMLELNEAQKKPLVMLPYSRSSTELSGALKTYIEGYIARHVSMDAAVARSEVEELLRDTLVVMGFGNTDRNWPDGPLYIFMSAISGREEGGTDQLTAATGVTELAPAGAGRDSVFIHHDGVFSEFDAHNFGASGAAALRLVMKMNGVNSFRGLYEAAASGMELRIPTYEETAASVVLTGGAEWVWNPPAAYDGVVLPTVEAAQALVGEFV